MAAVCVSAVGCWARMSALCFFGWHSWAALVAPSMTSEPLTHLVTAKTDTKTIGMEVKRSVCARCGLLRDRVCLPSGAGLV